jgi:hypothetical protein
MNDALPVRPSEAGPDILRTIQVQLDTLSAGQ